MHSAAAETCSPATEPAGVRRLMTTDLACIDYLQDIRGYEVVDIAGVRLGSVDALFIDDGGQRKVRLLHVNPDWPNETDVPKYLIPVDTIYNIRGGVVKLDRPRRMLAFAPRDDAALAKRRNLEFLFAHYVVTPFWERHYVYPPYPYYL